MWWINKFGSVSGPYSDEQVQRGIKQNQFTRLNKISSDQQTWTRLDETAFWNPTSQKPDDLELPDFTKGKAKLQMNRPGAPTELDIPSEDFARPVEGEPIQKEGILQKHKTAILVSGGVILGCIALMSVFLLTLSGGGRKDPNGGGQTNQTNIAAADFETIKKRVVLIHAKEGSGTGFLVKMNGKKYVMSNDHVVRSSSTPEMILVDGTKLRLGAFSVARDRDLARFEVDYPGECFEFSDKIPNNDDEIWIYGNSQGDDVITSLKGHVMGVGSKVIKVDAEFVHGNSGSPILDKEGKVVGVASYLKNGDRGKDWTTKDTQFDQVRRFGVRASNVEWVSVNRSNYEEDNRKFVEFRTYWKALVNYLVCDAVSADDFKTLKLVQLDIERKNFSNEGLAFHEMLLALSKSYAQSEGNQNKFVRMIKNRDELIDTLKKAIANEETTREKAEKVLADYDAKQQEQWEKVKAKLRDFNSKRKEALLMARDYLRNNNWACPLMEYGYSDSAEDFVGSIDWYQQIIDVQLDLNAEKLKDLNKKWRTIDTGVNDDEE